MVSQQEVHVEGLPRAFVDAFVTEVSTRAGQDADDVLAAFRTPVAERPGAVAAVMLRTLNQHPAIVRPPGVRSDGSEDLDRQQRAAVSADRLSGELRKQLERLAGTGSVVQQAAIGRAAAQSAIALVDAAAVADELRSRLELVSHLDGLPAGRTLDNDEFQSLVRDVAVHAVRDFAKHVVPDLAQSHREMRAREYKGRVVHGLWLAASGPDDTHLPPVRGKLDASAALQQGIVFEWARTTASHLVEELGLEEFVPGIASVATLSQRDQGAFGAGFAGALAVATRRDPAEVLNELSSVAAGGGDAQWRHAARLLAPELVRPGSDDQPEVATLARSLRDSCQSALDDLPVAWEQQHWYDLGVAVVKARAEAIEQVRAATLPPVARQQAGPAPGPAAGPGARPRGFTAQHGVER